MQKAIFVIAAFLTGMSLTSCFSGKRMMADGGEVVGQKGEAVAEPTPYGMVKVPRGYLKVGLEEQDSLWGNVIPGKEISVDGFWMDQTEVTNSMYRQFVYWVRDSIIRERLADPAYGGDETYKIEEDEYGEPITPHLNWKKPIPWRKPTEDEERAIESVYTYHPIEGTRMLDARQMNYRYEVFDYEKAAMRKYRLNPAERSLDTDNPANPDEVIMISKDTAYVDDDGNIVRQTITRPLSSLYDFLNTYIVNVYPDTTCWVNDFPNANNEVYMRTYFSSPSYNDYPVVGVTWEQANAFCAWRTEYLLRGLGPEVQLEAARARVSGVGDDDVRLPRQRAVGEVVVGDAGEVHGGQFLQRRQRAGALHGQLRHAVGGILQPGALGVVGGAPRPVLVDVGGVHHQQVLLGLILVDQQVVHNAPLLVGQAGVLHAAGGEGGHVVRGDFLQEGQRLRPFDPELAHVRHVEHAHGVAHRQVLVDDARVLYGHVVSRKFVHLGTQRDVFLGKWCGFHLDVFCLDDE